MTTPVWPESLPQWVLKDGFSLAQKDGRKRSQMDVGPSHVRRRFSAAVRPFSLQIIVDEGQSARFDRFWNEELSGGVLPFVKQDPIRHGTALFGGSGQVLQTEDEDDLLVTAYWCVQFAEGAPVTVSLGGPNYQISMNLFVLP